MGNAYSRLIVVGSLLSAAALAAREFKEPTDKQRKAQRLQKVNLVCNNKLLQDAIFCHCKTGYPCRRPPLAARKLRGSRIPVSTKRAQESKFDPEAIVTSGGRNGLVISATIVPTGTKMEKV